MSELKRYLERARAYEIECWPHNYGPTTEEQNERIDDAVEILRDQLRDAHAAFEDRLARLGDVAQHHDVREQIALVVDVHIAAFLAGLVRSGRLPAYPRMAATALRDRRT